MSKCEALLRWILLVAPLILHESAEAVSDLDRYLVRRAHEAAFDRCKALDSNSSEFEKELSVTACNEAFKALDTTGENPCQGWTDAKCRNLYGAEHQQCSCTIPAPGGSDKSDNKGDVTKLFQECAKNVLPADNPLGIGSLSLSDDKKHDNKQCGSTVHSKHFRLGESSRTQFKKKSTFKCSICNLTFSQRETLRHHIKQNHKGGATAAQREGPSNDRKSV